MSNKDYSSLFKKRLDEKKAEIRDALIQEYNRRLYEKINEVESLKSKILRV